MTEELQLKLQAMLDGELPPAQARKLRVLAAADPAAARLLAELEGVKSTMLGREQAAALPETREFYWSKIEQQIRRGERGARGVRAPWRLFLRRWLAPLAGAAALAGAITLALNKPHSEALNQVSAGEGFQARTFRDSSSGMTFVFLQEIRKTAEAGARPQPARIREDRTSFDMDFE
jgi:anti-sigma factor RsiW